MLNLNVNIRPVLFGKHAHKLALVENVVDVQQVKSKARASSAGAAAGFEGSEWQGDGAEYEGYEGYTNAFDVVVDATGR